MLHKILTAVTALAVVASLLAGAAGQAAAVSGYDSAYFGESAFLTLGPGQSGQFAVGFNNTGSTGWLTGSTSQVDLAVCLPDKMTCNTVSPNAAFNSQWLSSTDYATTSTTYVGPGQTGYFVYNVSVPTGTAPGTYRFNGDLALHGTASMIHPQGYYQDVEVPNVGAPAKLACAATPSTLEAGSTASATITVSVQDSLGNTVTTDSGRNITLAQSGLQASGQSNGSLDGLPQGAPETKGDSNGVATFTLQTAGGAGVGSTAAGTDQLSATTTNTAITGCNVNFTFSSAGAATQLNETVFNPSGQTTTTQYQYPAGVASRPDVRARLKDAAGVTVNATSDTVVTFTVDNGAICNFGSTASDPAATTRSQTIPTGSASTTVVGPSNFWVTGVPGSCTITESATGLTSATKTLTIAASGPAAKLAITSNTCSNTPDTASSSASVCDVIVQVQDASGNPVFASGTAIQLALTPNSRTACAAVIDATNGTAAGPGPTITGTTNGAGNVDFEVKDPRAETCTATATSAGLTQTATTVSFTGFGPADHLAASSSPSDIPNNGVATSTVTVCVKDAAGNTVSSASDSIGLNRSASTATSGAATNLISASPSTATSGCATFTTQSSGNTAATAGTDTWTPNDNSRTLPLIAPSTSATVHTF